MTHDWMCVAVTGATGFVGRHVTAKLLADGCQVRALVAGADVVIHLVGIIEERPKRGQTFERVHVEGTVNVLVAAKASGVRRWLHMSALGARPDAVSRYHQTKYAAEQLVRASGLDWTIFRPSLIHGPDGEFMRMVKRFCRGLLPPFMPYFGGGVFGTGGAGKLQPVWVEDVASAFAAAVREARAIGQTYAVGGPDVMTWPQLYRICAEHLGGRKRPVGIPAWLARLMAGWPGVPFNRDQVIMSQEDNTCQIDRLREHLGVAPAPFEAMFAAYADQIP